MLHYTKLLSLLGPLVRIWCMRFEAEHQILLAYARNCKNKINIPYSIATKHQLEMTYYFIAADSDCTHIIKHLI